MVPGAKPNFLNELARLGAELYELTTPEQRSVFLAGLADLLKGKPTKLERFAKLEAETIAIKAADAPR
jgi:hypothetical protein